VSSTTTDRETAGPFSGSGRPRGATAANDDQRQQLRGAYRSPWPAGVCDPKSQRLSGLVRKFVGGQVQAVGSPR
jgi:hypothetical protein